MLLCPFRLTELVYGKKIQGSREQLQTPAFISIVESNNCSSAENLIPLVDLPERRRVSKKANRNTHESRVEFAVCVPTLFRGDYLKPKDLLEFIEVNRFFGAGLFYIHVQPRAATDWLTGCLDRYQSINLVHWMLWSVPGDIALHVHYHGQKMLINDCIYRNMYRSTYLISQDFDEFIIPTAAENWHQMIEIMMRLRNNTYAAAYSFRNQFQFISTDVRVSPASQFEDMNTYKTMVPARADGTLFPHTTRSKMMVRSDSITRLFIHLVNEEDVVWQRNTTSKPKVVYVEKEDAILYHYRFDKTRSQQKQTSKMTKFKEKIIGHLTSGAQLCFGEHKLSVKSSPHYSKLVSITTVPGTIPKGGVMDINVEETR
jgi:hypothetical protein